MRQGTFVNIKVYLFSLQLYFVSYSGDWCNFAMPTDFVDHPDCSRYRIQFANEYAVKCYESYLAHVCLICEKK